MRLNDASVIVAQGETNHWSNAAYHGEENDDSSDGEGKEDICVFVYFLVSQTYRRVHPSLGQQRVGKGQETGGKEARKREWARSLQTKAIFLPRQNILVGQPSQNMHNVKMK